MSYLHYVQSFKFSRIQTYVVFNQVDIFEKR